MRGDEMPAIRQLELVDARELFRFWQAALREEPFAFVTSPEDDVASFESLREYLSRRPDALVFGAFDPEMVGMLGISRENRRKLAHKALIWGVFVREEYRGHGVGEQLLSVAIDHARSVDGLKALRLGVSQRSAPARRLYERAGFRVWGIEPDCIQYGGESADLCYLELKLVE